MEEKTRNRPPVRLLVYGLAILEILIGVGALIAALLLLSDREAGMTLLWLPFIAFWIPLALAGALLFLRRRWVYIVHLAILIIVAFLGTSLRAYYLPRQIVEAILTGFVPVLPGLGVSLLPLVRRWFGIGK